jgi:hypothetical protein
MAKFVIPTSRQIRFARYAALVLKADIRIDFTTCVREIQGVPKLVAQKSAVVTPELEIKICLEQSVFL